MKKCYKLIGIYLSRQPNKSIPQQISFTEKLEEGNAAAMIFVSEKEQFFFRFISCNRII